MVDTPEVQEAIQAYYRNDAEREWQRMERHRTEFAVTLRALEAHLPPTPARVLDCGGGPGRYAQALTQRGYTVTLFDLSPDLLVLARSRAAESGVTIADFAQGTATDLSRYPDDTFDAVLLMGPLYHLLEEDERRQALAEAYRVVKPGGPVFASFISRYSGHRYAARAEMEYLLTRPEESDALLAHGTLPPRPGGGFIAYFAHPLEVTPLCASVGLDVETVLGVEGLVSMIEEGVNTLEGEAWDAWVDLNYRLSADPSLHGAVEHLLAICRKPRWRAALRAIAQTLASAGIDYRVVGGAGLALRGLPIPVRDIDLEMTPADVYRFETLFADRVVERVAWSEGVEWRSHFGRFDFDGVTVEVMGGLSRRVGDHWAPSFLMTRADVAFEGLSVATSTLEEDALSAIRRGRLDRAAVILPHCDPERLQALLREALACEMF